MKKNKSWYFNPAVVISSFACLGVIGTAVVKSAVYITLPDRVSAAEGKVETIEDYIKEQQIANNLLKEFVIQEGKKEPILSPDGKKFWDESKKQWRPIQELGK